MQEVGGAAEPSIVNPAGPSFRSAPLTDALKICEEPILEPPLSNIQARDEPHRRDPA